MRRDKSGRFISNKALQRGVDGKFLPKKSQRPPDRPNTDKHADAASTATSDHHGSPTVHYSDFLAFIYFVFYSLKKSCNIVNIINTVKKPSQ